ncbi:MAG: YibE/F family protein [Ilumatobacteraceae bacterium]
MGSGHVHDHPLPAIPSTIERSLWVAVGVWALLTVLGLVLLWPSGGGTGTYRTDPTVHGSVIAAEVGPCTGTAVEDLVECRRLTLQLTTGEHTGEQTVLEQAVTAGNLPQPEVGDTLILTATEMADGTVVYNFADYERSSSMWFLVLLFVVAVVALGRWRGLGALAGLAVSVVVLVVFMLPALLDGSNPVVVAIVGASVIAFASLYLAHGFGAATNVALLSTLAALTLTGVLAWVFVELTSLTGLSDENALFLDALGVHLDPRGLLLAGVVIGSLGVLDDVTVTQVSAVGELHRANPAASFRELYRSAVVIGRDHISSTVNTLFLAYAGAALPLLLLFTEVRQAITDTVMREQVAVEVVRTLVGSIGLVAAVPLSTALAATVLMARSSAGAAVSPAAPAPDAASPLPHD